MGWTRACSALSVTLALMLFLSASDSEGRYLAQQIDPLFSSKAAAQGEMVNGASDVHVMEPEVIPAKTANTTEADYRDCYVVCCWEGDKRCPYPYCNYTDVQCSGIPGTGPGH